MPNALNSQYQFRKVNKIQLWNSDPREHNFSNSYIYFTFSSNSGGFVNVRTEFESDKERRTRNPQQQTDTLYYEDDELTPEASAAKFAEFARKILEDDAKTPKNDSLKDFVKLNINLASTWSREAHKRLEENAQILKIRIKQTNKKKEKIMIRNIKKNKRYIKRWDVVRKVNNLRNAEFQRMEQRQTFATAWIRFYHTFFILKNLAKKYNKVKNKEIRNLRISYCARRVEWFYRKNKKKRGDTLDTRIQRTAVMSLSTTQIGMYDIMRKRAKDTLKIYLEKTS